MIYFGRAMKELIIPHRARQMVALLFSLGLVAVDLLCAHRNIPLSQRALLAALSVMVLGCLNRWDMASLGLHWQTPQGFRYWIKISLLLGVAMAALTWTGFKVLALGRAHVDLSWRYPSVQIYFRDRFWSHVVWTPLIEEMIYRFGPVIALRSRFNDRIAILISGLLFALLHFIYGNPEPENLVGGFLLAWAFVKSRSIYLPILLHGTGNFALDLLHLL